MVRAVVMPKLGQSEETVKIVRWRKHLGETVAKGDIIFEIETDKAVLEVESFYEGTLLKILAGEGVTVPVQATVAFVGDPGEAVPDVQLAPLPVKKSEAAVAAPAPVHPSAPVERKAAPGPSAAPVATPVSATREPEVFRISPRAAKLAKESVIDPKPIVGTGPNGRIVEKDVRAYLDAKGYSKIRITPAAKKLVGLEGIDLLSLAPKENGSQI